MKTAVALLMVQKSGEPLGMYKIHMMEYTGIDYLSTDYPDLFYQQPQSTFLRSLTFVLAAVAFSGPMLEKMVRTISSFRAGGMNLRWLMGLMLGGLWD